MDLAPGYEQKRFELDERRNRFLLVGAPDGADSAVTIHQDVRLYLANVDAGQHLAHPLGADRHAWLQIVRGIVELADGELREGDGIGLSGEGSVQLNAHSDAELMLFDLA